MSFIVRVAEPTEYAEAGFVTADAYRIDDLLRRADGLIDTAYEAELTDAARRAGEATRRQRGLVAADREAVRRRAGPGDGDRRTRRRCDDG